jgi:GAF domain-containing protein
VTYSLAHVAHAVTTLTLEDTIGISSDAQAAPEKLVINLDGLCTFGAPSHWPIDLTRMVHGHEVSLHSPVKDMLGNLPLRGFIPEYPTHAALLPIMSGDELVGCLIVYIGPGQPINDRLKDFLDLLRRQLSTSASMVASYEQEVRSE